MTDFVDLYRRTLAEFDRRVGAVGADAWPERARCCPEWTVRDIVNHVVGECKWIPPLLQQKTIADVGPALDGDLLGDDPVGAWKDAAAAALAAVEAPGALDRTVTLSSGPAPATRYLAEVTSDQIVHTWDLADSIGGDERLDPELVEFAFATLEPLATEWRAAGVLGPPVAVSDEADRQTKLLAMLGRRSS